MRIAIIDLGTNTFNLLIADKDENGNFNTVFKHKIPVKLGEEGIDKGLIAPKPYQRGLKALENHIKTINEYKVDKHRAFATSAIRSTSNGHLFVKEVDELLGLKIEVIDGSKEAELIYYGVKEAVPFEETFDLIIDIGGGSTEFIIANKKGISWAKSYQLGVSRLKELFKPSDPISDKEIKKIEAYFESNLKDLFEELSKTPCLKLIGSSGSFDTLVDMICHQYNDKKRRKKKYCDIKLEEYDWAQKHIIKCNLNERIATPGMIEMRADMIVISVILINYILKKTNMEFINRSKYALKEGALNHYF